MNCFYKTFKLSLFVFNMVYILIGICVLLAAAFVYLHSSPINQLLKIEYAQQYTAFIYFLVVCAAVFIGVGFIGCVGILSERSWLLFVYFSLLFLIFALQFAGVIYLYVKSASLFGELRQQVARSIRHEYGRSAVHSLALDSMHYSFQCCGWLSPRDWQDSSYTDTKHLLAPPPPPPPSLASQQVVSLLASMDTYKIPHSCCVNNADVTCVLMHKFHEVGCEQPLRIYLGAAEERIAWLIAFLNLFQLILLVLALYVLCMVFFDSRFFNDTATAAAAARAAAGKCAADEQEEYAADGSCNDHRHHLHHQQQYNNFQDDRLFMTSYFL